MIELKIVARRTDLGGLEVGRVLPWRGRRMVGPFIFFDHIGPVVLPAGVPRSTDVRPHPHIGLATITYLFVGEIVHRDSLGCDQVIRPGEVNWMTAGRGITHSERYDTMREKGGLLHGIQAWVALPAQAEETAPAFVHVDAAQTPSMTADGVGVRVIAGSVFGLTSRVHTHSPTLYAHLRMRSGTSMVLPAGYSERAVFVAGGGASVAGERLVPGEMAVLTPGAEASIAASEDAEVMVLGGEPVGERHIWWNFVASSRERIERAKADWRAGRFILPLGDDQEFIPLPDDPAARPEPMS